MTALPSITSGVYDLSSEIPHVKYARIPSDGDCAVSMQDLLAFENFFVKIGRYERVFGHLIAFYAD